MPVGLKPDDIRIHEKTCSRYCTEIFTWLPNCQAPRRPKDRGQIPQRLHILFERRRKWRFPSSQNPDLVHRRRLRILNSGRDELGETVTWNRSKYANVVTWHGSTGSSRGNVWSTCAVLRARARCAGGSQWKPRPLKGKSNRDGWTDIPRSENRFRWSDRKRQTFGHARDRQLRRPLHVYGHLAGRRRFQT